MAAFCLLFNHFNFREPRQECADAYLRFEARQRCPQTHMHATAKGLVVCVFTFDVEAVRIRIDRGVVVGCGQRCCDGGSLCNCKAVQFCRCEWNATAVCDGAVVAKHFLDGVFNQRGPVSELCHLVRMGQQGVETVADQVGGGDVARDEQQSAHGLDFGGCETVICFLRTDQIGDQIMAGVFATNFDRVLEIGSHGFTGLFDPGGGAFVTHRVKSENQIIGPAFEIVPVLQGDAQHIGNHEGGKGACEIGNQVYLRLPGQFVEQVPGDAFSAGSHRLDGFGIEGLTDQRSEPLVVGCVQKQHRGLVACAPFFGCGAGDEPDVGVRCRLSGINAPIPISEHAAHVIVAGQEMPPQFGVLVDGGLLAQLIENFVNIFSIDLIESGQRYSLRERGSRVGCLSSRGGGTGACGQLSRWLFFRPWHGFSSQNHDNLSLRLWCGVGWCKVCFEPGLVRHLRIWTFGSKQGSLALMKSQLIRSDVLISGGGLAGLPMALAFAAEGFSVTVVDALDPALDLEPAFDGRASSVADASLTMLSKLGLDAHLAPHLQPINDIVVTDGRPGETAAPFFLHFDHAEIGDRPLGAMVENRHLRMALKAVVATVPQIRLLAPDRIARFEVEPGHVSAELQSGACVEASLLVGADGRASFVREQVGIQTVGWDYGQDGIVTTVEHALPHDGVAQEFFLPSGPFAVLPITGNRSSLVWTERRDLAKALLSLDEDGFEAECRKRFGPYLGEMKLVGPRWSYPLTLQLARDYVTPRVALIADAAHGIHPLAGQGLNLGLRDVAALAHVAADAARVGLDIGALVTLERYQRWRRFDNVSLALACDALNRLFSNDAGPVRLVRDLGLGLVNRVGPARRFFMRLAGGDVGDLPRLMRRDVA